MIGVEFPKITFTCYFFASDHLWMFRVCVVLLLLSLFFVGFFSANFFLNNFFLTWQTFFPKIFGWWTLSIGDQGWTKRLISRETLKPSCDYLTLISHNMEASQKVRVGSTDGRVCTGVITEMEERLNTKSMYERAHQMRKNLRVRKCPCKLASTALSTAATLGNLSCNSPTAARAHGRKWKLNPAMPAPHWRSACTSLAHT